MGSYILEEVETWVISSMFSIQKITGWKWVQTVWTLLDRLGGFVFFALVWIFFQIIIILSVYNYF